MMSSTLLFVSMRRQSEFDVTNNLQWNFIWLYHWARSCYDPNIRPPNFVIWILVILVSEQFAPFLILFPSWNVFKPYEFAVRIVGLKQNFHAQIGDRTGYEAGFRVTLSFYSQHLYFVQDTTRWKTTLHQDDSAIFSLQIIHDAMWYQPLYKLNAPVFPLKMCILEILVM